MHGTCKEKYHNKNYIVLLYPSLRNKRLGWCCLYHMCVEMDEQDDGQIGNVDKTKKNLQHERDKL